MAINEYNALHSTVEEECEDFDRDGADLHWSLGSPLRWTTAEILQRDLKDKDFAKNLQLFLNEFVVDRPLRPDEAIIVCSISCSTQHCSSVFRSNVIVASA